MKTTNAPKLRVLLVEDNPEDAALVQLELKGVASAVFEVTLVDRLKDALKLLRQQSFDVVLLDLSLPDSQGVETVAEINTQAPGAPIVVLTGLDDESTGLEAVRRGAEDYLVKGRADGASLSRVMRYARERKWQEQQLKQAYVELSKSQQELLETLSNLNKAHADLKIAQLELLQVAKLETIGRLASGLAQEVRRPLATLITGVDYLLTHKLAHADENAAHILRNMAEAIKRADEVIGELQQFTAPSDLNMAPEDFNSVIEKALALVQHEVGMRHITVERELADELPPLTIDANKIEQVLVGLLMNGIEASKHGQSITVRTIARLVDPEEVVLWAAMKSEPRFLAGQHVVVLEIEDSGPGIPNEQLEEVFEPFYTTKPAGQGTGLGLTVAKRIMQIHGGRLDLSNRIEGGVSVQLMFKV